MWLVDLNYNFECDWLIYLSDNKLSDNNLPSESVENRSFFKPITIEEVVIFMIKRGSMFPEWMFPEAFIARACLSNVSQFHKTGNIVSSVNFGSKMQIMLPLHDRES